MPEINTAYRAKDRAKFKSLTELWLGRMNDLEKLLAADPQFLLGTYLAGAMAVAKDDQEKAQLSYDQRSLLTVWWADKTTTDKFLKDYANREWSGLVSGLYIPRWKAYFDSLTQALETGASPKTVDWYAMEEAWSRKVEELPVTPTGDAYAIATAIVEKLAKPILTPDTPAPIDTVPVTPTCVPSKTKPC